MVFPVVMHGCESWNIKKSEHQRIDAFELWCWRRLLRVPWDARRSNQSILKEINPEYLLEGLMLKLKLQYFGHLIWRVNSLEKTLILGKIEGRSRMGQQRRRWQHWLNGHEFQQALGDGEGQGILACWSPWGHKELDMTEQLNNNNSCNIYEQLMSTMASKGYFSTWQCEVCACAGVGKVLPISRWGIFPSPWLFQGTNGIFGAGLANCSVILDDHWTFTTGAASHCYWLTSCLVI